MKLKKMKVKKDVSFCGVISRKIRGGCWSHLTAYTEAASRKGVKPSDATHYLGFRPFRNLK